MINSKSKMLILRFVFIFILCAARSENVWAVPLEFTSVSDFYYLTPKIKTRDRSVTVIQSRAEYLRIVGEAPIFDINWNKSFVVLAYAGIRNNGGHSVAVNSIELEQLKSKQKSKRKSGFAQKITVAVEESAPGPYCISPAIMTSPSAIIKVSRGNNKLNKESKILAVADYKVVSYECR